MADIAALTQMIEPEVTALGFDLVRVKLFGTGDERTLQIMAERRDTRQLVIADCAAISRRLSDLLDETDPIEEAYRLEVSSPGIDRPLTRPHDYTDWAGHDVRITVDPPVDTHKTFKGVLVGLEGDTVLIQDVKFGDVAIPLENISGAKLVLTDRLISATVPISTQGVDEIEDETETAISPEGQD